MRPSGWPRPELPGLDFLGNRCGPVEGLSQRVQRLEQDCVFALGTDANNGHRRTLK